MPPAATFRCAVRAPARTGPRPGAKAWPAVDGIVADRRGVILVFSRCPAPPSPASAHARLANPNPNLNIQCEPELHYFQLRIRTPASPLRIRTRTRRSCRTSIRPLAAAAAATVTHCATSSHRSMPAAQFAIRSCQSLVGVRRPGPGRGQSARVQLRCAQPQPPAVNCGSPSAHCDDDDGGVARGVVRVGRAPRGAGRM